jgi:hypothetical protein
VKQPCDCLKKRVFSLDFEIAATRPQCAAMTLVDRLELDHDEADAHHAAVAVLVQRDPPDDLFVG